MRFGRFQFSLRHVITLLVCTVVILALSVTGILVGEEMAEETERRLSDQAMGIAQSIALSPVVVQSLEGKGEEGAIQSFAEKVRRKTGVRFIVVMDMNGIRWSHPDPAKIGKRFVGRDEGKALHGDSYTSVAEGTLGASLRTFVPVKNGEGKQVGVVAVGLMKDRVEEAVGRRLRVLYPAIGFGLLVGILGAWALARKVKQVLFGLEPLQIARLLQERNAMLESVREGIVAVNREGQVILANGEAVRLFQKAGLSDDLIGRQAEEIIPRFRLKEVVENRSLQKDQELQMNGLTLLVNRAPILVDHHVIGALAVFRDKTEVKQLAEQLTGVKMYAEALRAKTHEFMNRLHVILGMVEIGEYRELSGYIRQWTDHYQLEVGSVSRLVKDPVLAGFLLSKMSAAREQGVELHLTGEGSWPKSPEAHVVDEWVTIVGNLIDNALEAVRKARQKEIDLVLKASDTQLSLSVSDTGGGIPKVLRRNIFVRGFSTKGEDRGFGLTLVQQSVERLGGTLWFSSGKDGTTFQVDLPREREEVSS